MTRKAKLEKALADLPKRKFTLHGDPSDESSWKWEVNPPPQAFWDDGLYVDVDEMEFRLAPLHAALLEAVEALERSKQVLDEIIHERYSDDLVMSEMVDNDPAYIELLKQEEALAKIDEALDHQTKISNL